MDRNRDDSEDTTTRLHKALCELAKLVNEATECAICKSPIDEAFGSANLRCGHAFCAPCLRDTFRFILSERIAAHSLHNQIPEGTLTDGIPSTVVAFRVLTETLFPDPVAFSSTYRETAISRRRWMRQKHAFFSYPCPMCRTLQSTPPNPLPHLTRLIHYLRNRLQPYADMNQGESTAGIPISYFDGLFQLRFF